MQKYRKKITDIHKYKSFLIQVVGHLRRLQTSTNQQTQYPDPLAVFYYSTNQFTKARSILSYP